MRNPSPFSVRAIHDVRPHAGGVRPHVDDVRSPAPPERRPTTSKLATWTTIGPWGGSALVHAAILIILVLCKFPFNETGTLLITAFSGVEQGLDEEFDFFVDEGDSAAAPLDPTPPTDDFHEQPAIDELALADFEDPVASATVTDSEAQDDEGLDSSESTISELLTSGLPSGLPSVSANRSGAVDEAGSVEEAVDQVTGSIQGRLAEDDLLVVWLLDASLSLQEDRHRIAERLKGFFEQTNQTDSEHRFVNAVATFGRGFREAVTPTQSSKPVLNSIQRTAIDKSGQEKVFTAVERCIGRYRQKWKSSMMIVIWTDESGDDVGRLNTTIERAKHANVSISIVGRSAVLGDADALHDWVDPKTKVYQQLPIRNGPDSAMPERLRLGYWFRGPPPHRVRQPGRRFPIWYGNDDLIGLTSGFSPWALTRLATETGGTFTIFDSESERAPYDSERLAAYRPAAGSVEQYMQALRNHPLRRAVHRTVEATHREQIELPDLMFFGIRSPQPPHMIQPLYFTPRVFRSRLAAHRGKLERQIKRYAYQVEKALAFVSEPDDLETGLDTWYDQETSPRWRAWYELTRGRLLAASVRAEEYRLAMADIMQRGELAETTNGLVIGPSYETRSEGVYASRATEARQLLSRCMEDHVDTPWHYLAERELAHGLGIRIQQMSYTPTGEISGKASGTSSQRFPRF